MLIAGLEERREAMQAQIDLIRTDLQDELNSCLREALAELPESIKCLSLGQFLILLNVTQEVNLPSVPMTGTKRKRTICGLDEGDLKRMTIGFGDDGRRVTRSMAAKMRQSGIFRESLVGDVPATPKLCPGLPETPLAIRQQLRAAPPATNRPNRIAGSTIRATNIVPKPVPAIDECDQKENKAPNPSVTNLIHMELSDGKIVDLDLTKSPGSVLSAVGKEKAVEVKEWLSQYANAFTSFLKRLGA